MEEGRVVLSLSILQLGLVGAALILVLGLGMFQLGRRFPSFAALKPATEVSEPAAKTPPPPPADKPTPRPAVTPGHGRTGAVQTPGSPDPNPPPRDEQRGAAAAPTILPPPTPTPRATPAPAAANPPAGPAPAAGAPAATPPAATPAAPGSHYVVVQHFPRSASAAAESARTYLAGHGIPCVVRTGRAEVLLLTNDVNSEAEAKALLKRVVDAGRDYDAAGNGYNFAKAYVRARSGG